MVQRKFSLLPLPAEVTHLLEIVEAPERLGRHLQLVYSVADQIVNGLAADFPRLYADYELVLFGAAIHDIGKVLHPEELYFGGHLHEECGPTLLSQLGVASVRGRFALTHGRWQTTDQLEDLLVAAADTVWCGRRCDLLEEKLTNCVAAVTGMPEWDVWARMDLILERIAARGVDRLAWQQTDFGTDRSSLRPLDCDKPSRPSDIFNKDQTNL